MNKLTVCIIARDEEELLPHCLDSMKYETGEQPNTLLMVNGREHRVRKPIWDELIIGIDTRTTDGTRDIAELFGAKIVDVEWPQDDNVRDFASARNQTQAHATGDYIWWIDADEILTHGHEEILRIVREGKVNSVRPCIVHSRDQFGKKLIYYPRQDMLAKRNSHEWVGNLHEFTKGDAGDVHPGIEVEQLERPQGDRPHGDTFASLRLNLQANTDAPWSERHLFYLLREHAGAPLNGKETNGHEQEGIALAEAMLKHSEMTTPIQRSHACILAGEMTARLGEPTEARAWYIKAVQEWAGWAEPYYALGALCYEIAMRQKNENAPPAICHVLFNEAVMWLFAASVPEPPAYFVDMTIYEWRRYQALAVALAQIGRLIEAQVWMMRAIEAEPAAQELKEQLQVIRNAMPRVVEARAVEGSSGEDEQDAIKTT